MVCFGVHKYILEKIAYRAQHTKYVHIFFATNSLVRFEKKKNSTL
jgi:hypothetical protein